MTELTVTVEKESPEGEGADAPVTPGRTDQRESILFSITLANMILLLTLIAVLAILTLPSIVAGILTGCLGGGVAAFVLIAALIGRAT